MSIVADRVRESTSTTGTGTLTLDGAPTGFRSFTGAFGNGVSVYYAIVGGAEWEIGIGTTGAGTLARDTVLASSAGGTTPVAFSAGVKDVFNTAPAAGLVLVGQLASANTPSTVVLRDASGNFSAGTITANLTGNISGTAPAGTLTGTTLASNVVSSSLTSVGTLGNLTVTNTIVGSVNGNAATATTLQTARNINGVSFNGSADITVAAAAGTLTGTTLASNVVSSSLTSVGTLANLTVTNPITGSVTGSSGSTTGNAATATALQTPRTINGVSFNGTADITVPAAAGTLTGATLAAGVTASSLTSVGTLTSLTVSGTATAGKFAPTANTVTGNGMYLPAENAVAFSTNGVERARIDANGNFGIGISSPTARLQINTVSDATALNISGYNTIKWDNSTELWFGGYTAAQWSTLKFATAGAERWRITSAGNLITGTDNAHDIGASGATRPRDVFIARRAVIDGITVGRGGQTTVSTNTAVGSSALNSASLTGTNNTAVGAFTLTNNTTSSNNTAVGGNALFTNSTGISNSAFGANALLDNTTGSNNTAVGFEAMRFNTTGSNNSAIGREALRTNTTGVSNSAMGREALRRIAGSNNVAVGFESGIAISRSVATLGAIVGGSLYTDGTYNNVNLVRSSGSTFDGLPTANITVSGGAVTAVTLVTGGSGFQATDTVLTATAASIGGTGSGFTVAVATLTGAVSNNNTLIGFQAANTQTEGSSNIAIGSGVQLDSLTGSNQINIGTRYFHDRIRLLERSTDPAKPAEGNVVLWMSDGTGLGDDGDVLIGSTAGGVTNYAILFDHSAGTTWP
jgi:hypothetical protein